MHVPESWRHMSWTVGHKHLEVSFTLLTFPFPRMFRVLSYFVSPRPTIFSFVLALFLVSAGVVQDKCLDRMSCGGEGSELELGACKKCCAKVCVCVCVKSAENNASGRWTRAHDCDLVWTAVTQGIYNPPIWLCDAHSLWSFRASRSTDIHPCIHAVSVIVFIQSSKNFCYAPRAFYFYTWA